MILRSLIDAGLRYSSAGKYGRVVHCFDTDVLIVAG
jgi:hypothetical protein